MNITPKLKLVSWNITLRCPLRCSHGYSDAGDVDISHPLSSDEAFTVLDQIKKTGSPVVILSDGEPMMREDILEIAGYGTEIGLTMAMGTSGYYIVKTLRLTCIPQFRRIADEMGIRNPQWAGMY